MKFKRTKTTLQPETERLKVILEQTLFLTNSFLMPPLCTIFILAPNGVANNPPPKITQPVDHKAKESVATFNFPEKRGDIYFFYLLQF